MSKKATVARQVLQERNDDTLGMADGSVIAPGSVLVDEEFQGVFVGPQVGTRSCREEPGSWSAEQDCASQNLLARIRRAMIIESKDLNDVMERVLDSQLELLPPVGREWFIRQVSDISKLVKLIKIKGKRTSCGKTIKGRVVDVVVGLTMMSTGASPAGTTIGKAWTRQKVWTCSRARSMNSRGGLLWLGVLTCRRSIGNRCRVRLRPYRDCGSAIAPRAFSGGGVRRWTGGSTTRRRSKCGASSSPAGIGLPASDRSTVWLRGRMTSF